MTKKKKEVKAPSKLESITIRVMIIIGLLSFANFLYFFYQPEFKGNNTLYVLLSILIFYGILKKLYLWYHYFSISVPKKPKKEREYTVDVLTTYFPGEPYEMTLKTLEAIQAIRHPHTAYLCDEANDPYLKKKCEKLGVIHVTRNNRIDAKAGNINNALQKATGEICLILDPDHIPKPNFIDEVLPYFEDDKIGYVQVVQAYYNKHESLVARGAAEQTFHFYGPMMMGMNTYGTVNAIGANCTFRRSALDSIGGHAPGLAEDMHTAMLLHAKGWKSVYVPKIVAKGLVPVDLTSYYKQQLKWSRGTFELLYKVYPKIFSKITTRQKIHYALLPLHYLIGFIYLISFLIPILSLFMFQMPWTGNFIYFIVISVPVYMSSLLIRTYIQKWVINKRERGFHVIGGILQIITWWIFSLGVIYTFVRKKIPYLPTPKGDDEDTNIAIIIPNLCVGILSITAILYGLNKDFTPFSLIMAFFALLNAIFMFTSVYGAIKLTNRNRILRNTLENKTIGSLKEVKAQVINVSNYIFNIVRRIALPTLITAVFLSFTFLKKFEYDSWDGIKTLSYKTPNQKYYGIYEPSNETGLSNLNEINRLKQQDNLNYQIVSFYVAWGDSKRSLISKNYLNNIKQQGMIPMITWEPWSENFKIADSISDLGQGKKMLHHIAEGKFDSYIKKMALDLRAFNDPVFLRFAHEFDNPSYPWSLSGENTPAEFKKAWLHVHTLFKELGVQNVKWVWNPWKDIAITTYYPGDDYVDWIGITLLNYGNLNSDGKWHNFNSLYKPFHDRLKKISSKPVILAEMGSLKLGGKQNSWYTNAFKTIDTKYKEINAVVFFNSRFDKNIPKNTIHYSQKYLDWSFYKLNAKDFSFFEKTTFKNKKSLSIQKNKKSNYTPIKIDTNIRGVGYQKYKQWTQNNYVAKKMNLEQDFKLMKELNINFIKYHESSFYNRNVLKYSKKNNLNVLYNFDIPQNIDFIKDTTKLHALKTRILESVKNLNNESHIKGWSLHDNIWSTLKFNYNHSKFLKQKTAYHQWLSKLIDDIKKIDSKRYIIQEIKLSQFTVDRVKELKLAGSKVDAFGLIIEDNFYLNDFLIYAQQENIQYLINSINTKQLTKNKTLLKHSIFITDWQNQWNTGEVSLNGLLDFRSKKKPAYLELKKMWNPKDKKHSYQLPVIRILKPAISLLEGNTVRYSALINYGNDWISSNNKSDKDRLEWILIKYNQYNKPIAIKPLGKGNEIDITIPKKFLTQYKIMATYTKGNSSVYEITKLNTNLHSSLK